MCQEGWSGADCSTPFCKGIPICSGHGTCQIISAASTSTGSGGSGGSTFLYSSSSTGVASGGSSSSAATGTSSGTTNSSLSGPQCICDSQWSGDYCEIKSCPGTPECSDNGECVVSNGGVPTCVCSVGFLAADCSRPDCSKLNACSGSGTCVVEDGVPTCSCDSGWGGDDCSDKQTNESKLVLALIICGCVLGGLLLISGCFYLYHRGINTHGVGSSTVSRHTSSGFFDPIAPKSNKIFVRGF